MTYEWHTSDIQMTYEYIRVAYGRHTSTSNDIRMPCEYIRVIYKRHANDTKNFKPYKGFGAFRS